MTVAGGLDALEVEALVTDRYLEALLLAAERRADDVPADPELDPAIRGAARRLRDELVRVHPSFRFEERLARRLAEAAAGLRLAAVAGGDGHGDPLPGAAPWRRRPRRRAGQPRAGGPPGRARGPGRRAGRRRPRAGAPRSRRRRDAAPRGRRRRRDACRRRADGASADRRPLLVGGALTSAALCLAGAAFVAWRLTRGAPTDPMARAVRLARAARAGRDAVVGGLA